MSLVDAGVSRQAAEYLTGKKRTYAPVLIGWFVRTYGLEALEWDPLTIEKEIEDDLGTEIDSDVFDMLMAAITAVTTDLVYLDVGVFDETVNAFNGDGLGEDMDSPTAFELASAVAQLYLIDPEPVLVKRGDSIWSPDIRAYARSVLDSEGITRSPRILDFVPSKAPSIQQTDEPDPFYTQASIEEQAVKAREIDHAIDGLVVLIVQQLADLGIEVRDLG